MLPLDEIDRRAERLEAAAIAGGAEPWMEWLSAYHAAMRAALHVKRRLEGRRSIDARARFRARARSGEREPATVATSRSCRPWRGRRRGRLNVVVFERLEAGFGARPGSIWQALFPERRSLPHREACMSAPMAPESRDALELRSYEFIRDLRSAALDARSPAAMRRLSCCSTGSTRWNRPAACAPNAAGCRCTSGCGRASELVAAAPAYVKGNSEGEFVFDHSLRALRRVAAATSNTTRS